MAPPDPSPQDAAEIEGSRMTLGEHLEELRRRLIHCLVAFAVAFVALYTQRHEVFEFIQGPHRKAAGWLNEAGVEHWDAHVQALLLESEGAEPEEGEPSVEGPPEGGEEAEDDGVTAEAGGDAPLRDPADPLNWFEPGYPERKVLNERYRVDESLSIFSPDGGFIVRMRVCFWISLFLAGPYCLWEMWRFVAAGLYKHERRIVQRFVPWSLGLFLGGVIFGYTMMVPYALYFLGLDSLGHPALNSATAVAGEYLQFLKALALALGVVFQLPVVMLVLTKLGIVEPRTFYHYRRHTIVGALIVAAILTPPDPVTQMMMAGPVIVLYEVGLWIARLTARKDRA